MTPAEKKVLWTRAGNRCSFPGCDQTLTGRVGDPTSVTGEEAHIIARKPSGPRGQRNGYLEDRIDAYDNLILLCAVHHKNVDDQPDRWTVEKLRLMKLNHELEIEANAFSGEQRSVLFPFYSHAASVMEEKARFDNWVGWTSNIIEEYPPMINRSFFDQLDSLADQLESLDYPEESARLPWAFRNYCSVYRDFAYFFAMNGHVDRYRPDSFLLDRKHKSLEEHGEWNPPLFDKFLAEYKSNYGIIVDFTLELTRAANLVVDLVKREVSREWRLTSPALGVHNLDGDGIIIPRYTVEEQSRVLAYPGAADFMKIRFTREAHSLQELWDQKPWQG
jgi:hypothetical protein